MKKLVLAIAMLSAAALAQPKAIPVAGTWEGESVCQVPKPCTTEHVIYEITGSAPDQITIKADKVVNGERQWMGAIACRWSEKDQMLRCPMEGRRPADWVFHLGGNTLSGTLTMRDEKLLYRKVEVRRKM